MLSSMAMEGSLSLRQGTTENFSPPDSSKVSLRPIATSSSVSTQSDAKPGHIMTSFLTPLEGSSSTVCWA